MARTPNLRQNAPKPDAPKPISLPKVQSVPFTGNSGHPKIPSGPQAITGDAARAQVRADMDSHRLPTRRVDGVEKVRRSAMTWPFTPSVARWKANAKRRCPPASPASGHYRPTRVQRQSLRPRRSTTPARLTSRTPSNPPSVIRGTSSPLKAGADTFPSTVLLA
jgi:hypothetical protein